MREVRVSVRAGGEGVATLASPVHAAPVKAPSEPHVYEPPPLYPVTQVTVTVSPVPPARVATPLA